MRWTLCYIALAIFVGCQHAPAPLVKAEPAKPQAATTPTTAPTELTVMTFNLRFASIKPPNAWWQRRAAMRDCIRSVDPDLFGTQEGLYGQLKDMEADLAGDYAWIGLGRDGGSKGEFMAVFYRKSRFEPLEYDHFWLSDSPNVIASSTWGNSNRRMVTWVRFLDRRGNRELYFWNTHLDHQIQPAREKAAALIRQRIEGLKTDGRPVILVGDFNARAKGNKAYDILTADGFLKDTWTGEEQGSFHDFSGAAKASLGRIDWILTRGEVGVVGTPEIVRFARDGQYPSDHYPVVARLRF
jgi:endonuclease/exonuclease/phosphatase family metal-dependent hydrolase